MGLDHREVGGELEDVPGEALLSDADATLLRQLAQPVGVTTLVGAAGVESNLLDAANLPLGGDHLRELNQPDDSDDGDDDDDDDGDEDDDDDGGDHLGELNQPGVGAKGRCSSLPSAERLLLSTN